MLTRKVLFKFPISFFAIPMGLLGISSEASHLAEIYTQVNNNFTFIINIIAWSIFALAMTLSAKNWFTSEGRKFIKEQWQCPHSLIEYSIFSMAIILFIFSIHPYLNNSIAEILFYIIISWHLFLNIEILKRWIGGSVVVIEDFKPIIFVLLSGNFMLVVAGYRFLPGVMTELLWFFFSISLVMWFVFQFLTFYRLIFLNNFSAKFRPSIFILLSSSSLAIVSYHYCLNKT